LFADAIDEAADPGAPDRVQTGFSREVIQRPPQAPIMSTPASTASSAQGLQSVRRFLSITLLQKYYSTL
jgi:hypothetical protein